MEYGDVITPDAIRRAVEIARSRQGNEALAAAAVAPDAVARAFCTCVVDGQDAAEGRLSDLHRQIIEAVVDGLEANPHLEDGANNSREARSWP